MAQAFYYSSNVLLCNDTTNVRAIGTEIQAGFAGAGMSRTADTGQIDWATVTAPAVNALIGYDNWYICGGALVMRVEYQMPDNLTTKPMRIRIIVGTGSNGSGTITGVIHTGTLPINNNVAVLSSPKMSHVSNPAKGDFFGWTYKVGGASSGGSCSPSLFATTIEKISGADGDPDGSGYAFKFMSPTGGGSGGLSNTLMAADIGVGAYVHAAAGTPYHTLFPNGASLTDTSVGTDKQVFLPQILTPRAKFTLGTCGVLIPEFAANTTFNACLIGDPATKTRGYIGVGYAFGSPNTATTANTFGNAMLWEP